METSLSRFNKHFNRDIVVMTTSLRRLVYMLSKLGVKCSGRDNLMWTGPNNIAPPWPANNDWGIWETKQKVEKFLTTKT